MAKRKDVPEQAEQWERYPGYRAGHEPGLWVRISARGEISLSQEVAAAVPDGHKRVIIEVNVARTALRLIPQREITPPTLAISAKGGGTFIGARRALAGWGLLPAARTQYPVTLAGETWFLVDLTQPILLPSRAQPQEPLVLSFTGTSGSGL